MRNVSKPSEIGRYIRGKRKLRGWTLQELGDRCNLSVSFLSQMERGLSPPSIISLNVICRALKIPLSLLVGFKESKDNLLQTGSPFEISKVGHWPNIQISSASIKYQFLSGDFPGRLFEILIGGIPPHYNYPLVAHEGEEFGCVLEGNLRLKIIEECHELGVGDSYRFMVIAPHGYETNGEKSAPRFCGYKR